MARMKLKDREGISAPSTLSESRRFCRVGTAHQRGYAQSRGGGRCPPDACAQRRIVTLGRCGPLSRSG